MSEHDEEEMPFGRRVHEPTTIALEDALASLKQSLARGDDIMSGDWSGGSFKSKAVRVVIAVIEADGAGGKSRAVMSAEIHFWKQMWEQAVEKYTAHRMALEKAQAALLSGQPQVVGDDTVYPLDGALVGNALNAIRAVLASENAPASQPTESEG